MSSNRAPKRRPRGNRRRRNVSRQNNQTRNHSMRAPIQTGPERYVDTIVTGSITGSGSLNQISDVAQGVAQSQRTGDRIHIVKFIWNYTLYQENADVVNTVRLMVVQFVPSTALLAAAVTDFLQTASPTAFYTHETKANYHVLYDRTFRLAGTSTAPTSTSALGHNNVLIRPRRRICDFALGSTTGGTNQCFVLLIGDSVIAPYAGITSTVRMVYRNGD